LKKAKTGLTKRIALFYEENSFLGGAAQAIGLMPSSEKFAPFKKLFTLVLVYVSTTPHF